MPHHPIAITGMHRTGTSMVTRGLHDSGLHLIGEGAEELIEAAEDNPEGFWENKAIVACNDELLEAAGGSWDNPPELLPQAVDDARLAAISEPASAALAALRDHERWGFKDPRTCLTAAYWLDLEPDLRFVICLRHPLEVALSLKRRNQNSYSLGLALWERYYRAILDVVPEDRRIITHYDTFFVDPRGELERICRFAGLDAAAPRVRDDLRHHTVGVSLTDAGVSPSLRGLYTELCREAGALVPRNPTADEGRVRRLILDGAVAQRHADQRQAAIDRLEEREQELRARHEAARAEQAEQLRALRERLRVAEERGRTERAALADRFRTERAALEARHRETVRSVERRLDIALEAAQLREGTLAALQSIETGLDEVGTTVGRIDQRTETTSQRVEVAIGLVQPTRSGAVFRRVIVRLDDTVAPRASRLVSRLRSLGRRAARATAHQLPAPAQEQARRAQRIARRGIGDPRGTTRAVTRRAQRAGAARARQLPEPTQLQLRRARSVYRRALAEPEWAVRRVTHRLPASAQDQLRRIQAALERARASRSEPVPAEFAPRSTPKGPPIRQWRPAYEKMVHAAWTGSDGWLAVTEGSPREATAVRTPSGTEFPDSTCRWFIDDQSYLAHLEAARFDDHRHLVVPEGSRPWLRAHNELRDHLASTYRIVADEAGAGLVFDLSEPSSPSARSLGNVVVDLGDEAGALPAVLDWTTLDVAREIPDVTTFRPPAEGLRRDVLPYLDRSVDVVVIDRADRRPEARRVASEAVVMVADSPSGVSVLEVESLEPDTATAPGPRVLVWAASSADDRWVTELRHRTERAGAELATGPLREAEIGGHHDVLVLLESMVLPLPGAIEMAAGMAGQGAAAVTGKVLRGDGRLESAGGTVFSDRSVGLIGHGSADVRGAWHEYVRPVCWGSGLLAVPAGSWRDSPPLPYLDDRALLREWCAGAWARGEEVVYQPAALGVRVGRDGGEPSIPLDRSAWQRVLDLRPPRPPTLRDGEWRYLLAHDDVTLLRP